MGLASYVENLRERPEEHRKRHAFWWAFVVAVVIAVFYIASFTNIGIGVNAKMSEARKFSVATAEKVVSPGSSLVAGVGELAGSIWSSIVGPKKVELSEIEVVPGAK